MKFTVIVFFIFFKFGETNGGCVFLSCPATSTEKSLTIPCNECSNCSKKSMSYCQAQRNQTCSCIPSVNPKCSQVAVQGYEQVTVCRIKVEQKIPQPIVRPRGKFAISVVVPRFFSEPEFSGLVLSQLFLVTRFQSKNATVCQDFYSFKARKLGSNDCLMKIRIQMPGIDHKTDNNYYYDDGSEIEVEVANDLFENSENAQFYLEVDIGNESPIASGMIVIPSLARSLPVNHKFQKSPIVSLNSTQEH